VVGHREGLLSSAYRGGFLQQIAEELGCSLGKA